MMTMLPLFVAGFVAYGHAVHSFTQKDAGDDPSKGAAYNAHADRDRHPHASPHHLVRLFADTGAALR